jgi:hypothetical protein
MNYENYERKIVECYGVDLVGWPSQLGKLTNPGSIGGREKVTILLEALYRERCHWTALSDEELEERIADNKERAERGEVVYKERRPRAPRKSTVKSAAEVRGSDESSDNGGDDEDSMDLDAE